MNDISTTWLISQIQQSSTTNSIWCCDENVLHQIPAMHTWQQKPLFITNRWDIAEQAKHAGFNSQFNDFDLSNIADNSIDHFFYRISKEKAVTHHLINEASRVLKPQGQLWLSGQKNEGVKTYIEKASELFGCEKRIQKDGAGYSSALSKNTIADSLLNDENYSHLRPCLSINENNVFSKPGQFGWNKIDQGSEFLIAEVSKIIDNNTPSFDRYLDLGCGYGYLTIASKFFPIQTRVLTDNNAAALKSAQYNCQQLGIAAEVLASDAGQQIPNNFDLILCNPPFHQGFSVDGDLTNKFLQNTHQLLNKYGTAYFVVNQFIPLEKKAQSYFSKVKLIAQNKSFKVVELHKN